jgi:hypothetical protein
MATASSSPKSTVLNSWKEIAAYLGRGVRTVQRYERELGLPVRRPRGKSRSAVIALTEDLDNWLRTAPTSELRKGPKRQVPLVITQVHQSIGQGNSLRMQANQLRLAHTEEIAKLVNNLSMMVEELRLPPPRSKENGRGHGRSLNRQNGRAV